MATGVGPPSFFKVVLNPSSPHLSLPRAFVERNLEKIPKNPTLKTETGEHSWKLEITKIGEDYCFAHGWEKLVKDVQLCSRDVVVFWLIDTFTFKVVFLDANGCDKDLPFNVNDDNVGDGDDEVMVDENLSFQKVISLKTYKRYLSLPKKFVVAAGLEDSRGLMVKDHEGKEWIMGIMAERNDRTKYLSAGWPNFRDHHQLSDGDICVFKFNKKEGVLYLVQLIKSTTPILKQEFQVASPHGGTDVKIEDECSPIEKCCGGNGGGRVKEVGRQSGGGVEVKIEDQEVVVVVKRKRGRPPLGGGSGAPKVEPEEKLVRTKFVVYF